MSAEPTPTSAEAFGTRLRARREELGVSQEVTAKLAGMNVSNYGKLERGHGNPELATILRLASVLKIDGGALITGLPGSPKTGKAKLFSVDDFLAAAEEASD